MAASKNRPLWHELPKWVQAEVERLAGGRVLTARNCPGGFSPGLASRLTLADGRRAFVKAMDVDTWPDEAVPHRTEATIAAALPATVAAPALLGTFDDGHWVVLVFEDIDGAEPVQPWRGNELRRAMVALDQMTQALTPSPIHLPSEHPRLGGWVELAHDAERLALLSTHSGWATHNLARLIQLEQDGLVAALGNGLAHFDPYPHNILLTRGRDVAGRGNGVYFVDWPHARLAHPAVDVIILLSSAAADRIDPEPFLPDRIAMDRTRVDAILAAHTGFLLAGGLSELPPGLEAISRAKLHLGRGALWWLRRRLDG